MASSFTRFLHHNDAPQSVGLLWTSDQLVAETSTCQHTTLTTNIHAAGGIRTYNLSRRGPQTYALGRGTTGIQFLLDKITKDAQSVDTAIRNVTSTIIERLQRHTEELTKIWRLKTACILPLVLSTKGIISKK
jgi:hypothetical protein